MPDPPCAEEELEKRGKELKRPERKLGGVLSAYRKGVGCASEGAIWLFGTMKKRTDRLVGTRQPPEKTGAVLCV